MMRTIVVFLTSLLISAHAFAQSSHAALVEEALRVSQTERVMDAVSSAMVESMTSQPQLARLKPEQRSRIGAAMGRAYSTNRFVNRIRELLVSQASDDELHEFIEHSQSQLARQALEMEIVSSSASTQLIERHAHSIAMDPETLARINAVRRLDAASGGTEMLLAISVAITLSSAEMQKRLMTDAESGLSTNPDGQHQGSSPRRAKAPREDVESLARSIRPRVHREVINGGLFAYRWLTLDQLHAYVDLHERPAMRKMASLINDAMGSIFMIAQREAIEQILLELQGRGETPV